MSPQTTRPCSGALVGEVTDGKKNFWPQTSALKLVPHTSPAVVGRRSFQQPPQIKHVVLPEFSRGGHVRIARLQVQRAHVNAVKGLKSVQVPRVQREIVVGQPCHVRPVLEKVMRLLHIRSRGKHEVFSHWLVGEEILGIQQGGKGQIVTVELRASVSADSGAGCVLYLLARTRTRVRMRITQNLWCHRAMQLLGCPGITQQTLHGDRCSMANVSPDKAFCVWNSGTFRAQR